MKRWKTLSCALSVVVACCIALIAVPTASAISPPSSDPFYKYTGSTPLANVAPGTALKTRTTLYHILGLPLLLKTTQILYRSTDAQGRPAVNVTSVVEPGLNPLFGSSKVLSYQSAYDSLSTNDQPSYVIAGGVTLGGILPNVETALFTPYLLKGYTIVISDTEGQQADFAAGPEYGYNTLDSIRASVNSSAVNISSSSKFGMIGYSGGAIATEWAAELAPTYAPDVNSKLVGAAMGGVLVDPAHNLHYVEGSTVWAGVMPMAIVGIARSYGIDLTPYLSANGLAIYNKMKNASIVNVLAQYSGLKWTDLAKPQYATPESVPEYVTVANKLIMGTGGTPTTPLFIGQGANGELEGTPGTGTYGKGDGVMIAGDVRTLARKYCAAGKKIKYSQYDSLSHVTSLLPWLPEAIGYLNDRFAGKTAPQNCSSIAPGNALDPIPAP